MQSIGKNTNKLYVAYGSNLNISQMERRCPYAVPLGTAELVGYGIMFRGDRNAVATVELMEGASVPVLLWEITPRCEEALDRYEGWPRLYRKETISVAFNGKLTEAMIYIMNEIYHYGLPSDSYLHTIKEGYASAGFDTAVLDAAVAASGAVTAIAKNCKVCGCAMAWENPHLPGYFQASSCNLEDWDTCHDCMVDHCVTTNCLGCRLGKYPECRFTEMKKHYMEFQ